MVSVGTTQFYTRHKKMMFGPNVTAGDFKQEYLCITGENIPEFI